MTRASSRQRRGAIVSPPLDSAGQVPEANLPASVDDVLQFANLAGFPATGATGIIYVAADTNKIYRWSGSAYVELAQLPDTVVTTTGTQTVSGKTYSGPNAFTGANTVASGGNIQLYNTADQTTNYERVSMLWSGNQFQILNQSGGTGSVTRRVNINNRLIVNSVSVPVGPSTGSTVAAFTSSSSATVGQLGCHGTLSASSGLQYSLSATPTMNQSGTAGYTALLVNVTETATGSGSKLLSDWQVGGSSRAKLDNTGLLTINAVAPSRTSVATAAGTTTLDITSAQTRVFTGTTTQTVKLPTTSVVAGQQYTIINQSTGDVTVQSSGGNTIETMTGGADPTAKLFIALQDTPTADTHWRAI